MKKEYLEPEIDLLKINFEQILEGDVTDSNLDLEDPAQHVFD